LNLIEKVFTHRDQAFDNAQLDNISVFANQFAPCDLMRLEHSVHGLALLIYLGPMVNVSGLNPRFLNPDLLQVVNLLLPLEIGKKVLATLQLLLGFEFPVQGLSVSSILESLRLFIGCSQLHHARQKCH
jgi:hypothetical protein